MKTFKTILIRILGIICIMVFSTSISLLISIPDILTYYNIEITVWVTILVIISMGLLFIPLVYLAILGLNLVFEDWI